MELTDLDLSKAYKIIDEMQIGQIIDLANVAADRRAIFIECVKHRIYYQGDAELNGDESKVKKIINYYGK